MPPRTLFLLLLPLTTPMLPVAAAPRRGAPRVKAPVRKAPAGKVVVPPGAPPVISIAHSDLVYRAPERRLARFITALQTGKRRRAVAMFSSRIPAPDRQAFLQGEWLKRNPGHPEDFTQILFMKDLQIRPRGVIKGETLRLEVVPRDIPYYAEKVVKDRPHAKPRPLIGNLVVPMRREHGEWFVELRPEQPR